MHCPVCGTYNPDGAQVCRACGASLAGPAQGYGGDVLPPGSRLSGGTITVGKVLGQGGFGITYLGSISRTHQVVAIKEFFPHGSVRHGRDVHPSSMMTPADFLEARTKFIEEAEILSRFKHPNICRVFGYFEENNTAYMVMEYLKGKTLARLIEERGAIPERESLGYIREVGKALAVVHREGVLHRDIKPENVIITDDNRVVLLDFGSARGFAAGKTSRMTSLLTPGYAPLEQYAEMAQRGPYTDIYALSATLYHMLTGQMPVQATDRVTGVQLRSPREVNPEVSRPTSDAVMWGMETKVGDRPQNVADFLKALRSGRPKPAPKAQPRPSPYPRPRRRPQPPPRRRFIEIIPGLPIPIEWADHCVSAFIGSLAGAVFGSATIGFGGFLLGGMFGFMLGIMFGRTLVYFLLTGLSGAVGYWLSGPIGRWAGYTGQYLPYIGIGGGILLGLLLAYILSRKWR